MNVLLRINQLLLDVTLPLFRFHPIREESLQMQQSFFEWTRVADQGAFSV